MLHSNRFRKSIYGIVVYKKSFVKTSKLNNVYSLSISQA